MPIYFFEFEVQPEPTNSRYAEIGGAFITCWVVGDEIESARYRCKQELALDAWLLISEERAFEADRTLLEGNENSMSMFDQAAVDGLCYTVRSWPNEPQEEDDIH